MLIFYQATRNNGFLGTEQNSFAQINAERSGKATETDSEARAKYVRYPMSHSAVPGAFVPLSLTRGWFVSVALHAPHTLSGKATGRGCGSRVRPTREGEPVLRAPIANSPVARGDRIPLCLAGQKP